MNSKRSRLRFLIILCVIGLCSNIGMSLIITGGGEAIRDHGWPNGSVEMANLPLRWGYWEGPPFGGGEYHFLYRCDNTAEFNEALKTFAAIHAKKLELVVHNGPEYSFWLKDDKEELSKAENLVDWAFMVCNPESWKQLYNSPRSYMFSSHPNFNKPIAAPRVDVYIGGGGSIVWEDVKVPENVQVIDKRPVSVSPKFAGKGLIRGKVFDMTTGEPIVGAEIVLAKLLEDHRNWKEVMHDKTNKRGICRIAKIPPGYYEVKVKAEGYVSRKQGRYNNKRPEYYKFKVGLAKPSYVKGIVTDVIGIPIEGVKVSATNVIGTDGFGYSCISDTSAVTDKQGIFVICSLPDGLMNIRCRDTSLHLKNSIFEQYPIPSDEIKLTMTGTSIIRGRVVSKDGQVPSGDVHIHIRPPGEQLGKWGGSRKCEGDGSFEFTGVPPGEYLVGTDYALLTEGDRTNAKLISVQAGKTYELEVVHVDQKKRR